MKRIILTIFSFLMIFTSLGFVSAAGDGDVPTEASQVEGYHSILHLGDQIRALFVGGSPSVAFEQRDIILNSDASDLLDILSIRSGTTPAIFSGRNLVLQYNPSTGASTGNLGIGVANPTSRLEVAGGVAAQDVSVVNDVTVAGDVVIGKGLRLGPGSDDPQDGDLKYDSTSGKIQVRHGVVWQDIEGTSGDSQWVQQDNTICYSDGIGGGIEPICIHAGGSQAITSNAYYEWDSAEDGTDWFWSEDGFASGISFSSQGVSFMYAGVGSQDNQVPEWKRSFQVQEDGDIILDLTPESEGGGDLVHLDY